MQHPNPATDIAALRDPVAASLEAQRFKLSAVVIGFVVDVVASFVLLALGGGFVGLYLASTGTPPAEISEAAMAAMGTSAWLLATLVMGLLATAMGGFVAARMARHAPGKHALALGVGVLLMAALMEAGCGSEAAQTPLWYDAVAYLMTVPAALGGGALVRPAE